jgi:arsenate reductase
VLRSNLLQLTRAEEPRQWNMQSRYNVLFPCTGNSARSIMAEAVLNRKGFPTFRGCSAGSQPKGAVHPAALRQLETAKLPTTGLRSKPWDEFALPAAPQMDFVFTICDNAAKEVCPVWPGQPMTARWGVPDPAAVKGSDRKGIPRCIPDARSKNRSFRIPSVSKPRQTRDHKRN